MKRATLFVAMAGFAATGSLAAQDGAAVTGTASAQTTVTGPLGLTQNAWNEPLRKRGASMKRPGYVRYVYDAQQAFPIRIREGMITTIKLPAGEEVVEAYVGDTAGFNVALPNAKNIVVKANFPGVDTNLIAYSESGNIYTFYLRSEAYNSKEISDFLVDVVSPDQKDSYTGSQMDAMTPSQMATYDANNPSATALKVRDPYATSKVSMDPRYREYAEWTDFDPSKVREDLGVYVPVKQTGGTIPYRIFRDDRFTYVDYGPEASQMTEWPTPMIVIQGVEGPVGNRTVGPGGRMIVIEALGDFVLRNGQRIIIVKPRSSSPDAGLVEYPIASKAPMSIPSDLPPGRNPDAASNPKTLVADRAAPTTIEGEKPSRVVPATPAAGKAASRGSVTTTYTKAEVVQEIPVAKGGGSPIRVADEISTTKTTIAPASAAPATLAAPKTVVVVPAGPTYYVSLGSGTRAELEERWRSAKVQHYEQLAGRQPTYVDGPTGIEMRVEGYSSPTAAIALCNAMTEQKQCSVRTKN